MSTVKVIYGSTSGNTENAATVIAGKLGGEAINVADATPTDFVADLLILGTSTWGVGDLQDDWLGGESMLDKVDLSGKKVAIFGLGDQFGFGDTFIDGVGALYSKAVALGAVVVGTWDTDGYEHTGSTAELDGVFVGLALDEDNESDKTEGRIDQWCEQLKSEAGL